MIFSMGAYLRPAVGEQSFQSGFHHIKEVGSGGFDQAELCRLGEKGKNVRDGHKRADLQGDRLVKMGRTLKGYSSDLSFLNDLAALSKFLMLSAT